MSDNLKDPVDDLQEKIKPSPLSNFDLKKLGSKAVFGIAGALLVYAMFTSGHHKEAKKSTADDVKTPELNIPAPTLTVTPEQAQKLKNLNLSNATLPPPQENEEEAKLEKMRMVAPIMVYSDDEAASKNVSGMDKDGGVNYNVLGGGAGDANSQFMSKVSATSTNTIEASHIAHPPYVITQGTIIQATLETRISSDLPGMLRAVTSGDIYSADGANVLLPKGTILVGQFSSGIIQGQNRIFAVWQRATRPDHITIQLNSPGTDPLGTSGFGADSVDYHIVQQFGTAGALSLIGAGAANVGVNSSDQFNSASEYRSALASSFAQQAQNSFQNQGIIKPTLVVNQGDKISVFIANDLDFYNELNGKL